MNYNYKEHKYPAKEEKIVDKENNLEYLKKELKWLNETPFYVGKDGATSLVLVTIGAIPAIIIKALRKSYLKRRIEELEKKKK